MVSIFINFICHLGRNEEREEQFGTLLAEIDSKIYKN